MRSFVNSIVGSRLWLVAAVVLAIMLAVVCGCEDDASTMAQQMGGSRRQSTASSSPQNNPPQQAEPARPADGAPEMASPGSEGGDEGAAEDANSEYAGPVVIAEELQVDAPYPEFNGEGRYDITVSVHAEEPVDGGVWDIILLDEEDEEVGKQQQFLVIPSAVPKSLVFYAFYCKSMPSKIEFRLTDKEAVIAGAEGGDTGSSDGGRGMAGAGGGGGASERTGGSGGMDRGAGSGGGDEDEDF